MLSAEGKTQNHEEEIMKRFHVHVAVDDLEESIRFYSAMFGAPPSLSKPDYAKWMLEDPRLNFAISRRGRTPGIDHLGVQVETDEELSALREQAARAEIGAVDQKNTTCCYARSDKYWTLDPQGIAWETFHTLDSAPMYGEPGSSGQESCCAPTPTREPAEKTACC
jgi:catechol 2,3-dioxygenase-like lactoylglutathione lyase family enzyme